MVCVNFGFSYSPSIMSLSVEVGVCSRFAILSVYGNSYCCCVSPEAEQSKTKRRMTGTEGRGGGKGSSLHERHNGQLYQKSAIVRLGQVRSQAHGGFTFDGIPAHHDRWERGAWRAERLLLRRLSSYCKG
jgi:hypothetical protein